MSDQVNLHCHSEGSFLDGYATVEDIASRAIELGQRAIALTDHGECSQHFAFQKACQKYDIHPVFGMEGYWTHSIPEAKKHKRFSAAPVSHICLLAKDQRGLANLWAWSSVAYDRQHHWYKPIADPALMRTYAEGLYGSDSCMLTTFADHIAKGNEDLAKQELGFLLDVFRENFYMELHTWRILTPVTPEEEALNARMTQLNQAKLRLANEMGVPLVVVNDSHHARPEDWKYKDLVWNINTATMDQVGEGGQKADHIMGEDELFTSMAAHGIGRSVVEECIKNSAEIAGNCTAEVRPALTIPRFSASERDDMIKFLDMVNAGFERKVTQGGLDVGRYWKRMETEVELICQKRFCGYFLVVHDYTKAARSGTWAQYLTSGAERQPMQIGPGRGSCGGSLVAWLLDITAIDPVKNGLLFERFLAPARKGYPDIDTDFPQSKRPGMKQYLEARYGHDHVCTIGTITRNAAKGMLRDLGRAMSIPYADVDAMSKIIVQAAQVIADEQGHEGEGLGWDEIIAEKGGALKTWHQTYPHLFKSMEKMVGVARQSGVHPSGVLVNSDPLMGQIPLRTRKHNTNAEVTTSQFDMGEIEELGGVKFDLLGIRHMDTLDQAKQLIYERHGEDIVLEDLTDDDLNNPVIWEQIDQGYTVGVFQLETPGTTRDAMEFKPRCLSDVRDLLSIIRPGVADAGLKDKYLNRRAGKEATYYDHPLMEEIVGETYGVLIYQEQLFVTVQRLANFAVDEAYDLVKVVGKKQAEKLEPISLRFYEGCKNNPEFTDPYDGNWDKAKDAAERIWNSIQASGRYLFNKSHATGYGLTATWEVWLKHHYPMEMLTALLATDADSTHRYLREARRRGIKVLPPDINKSGEKFLLVGDEIRYGLDAVAGVGGAIARDIRRGQPYASFNDYLERSGRGAAKGVVVNLTCLGAFDGMGDRVALLKEFERYRILYKRKTTLTPEKADQIVATKITEKPGEFLIEVPDFNDPSVIQRIEEELLGNFVTVDPLAPYIKVIEVNAISHPLDMAGKAVGEIFTIGGLLTKAKLHIIAKGRSQGQEMAFLNISWNEEDFDVVVFPQKWREIKGLAKLGSPIACDVSKTEKGCTLVRMERLDLLFERE